MCHGLTAVKGLNVCFAKSTQARFGIDLRGSKSYIPKKAGRTGFLHGHRTRASATPTNVMSDITMRILPSPPAATAARCWLPEGRACRRR